MPNVQKNIQNPYFFLKMIRGGRSITISPTIINKSKNPKLWVDIKRPTSSGKPENNAHSLTFGTKNKEVGGATQPPPQVRSTVTTLLRQHQIVQKHEQKEKEKVEGFLQRNNSFDFDHWKRHKELEALKVTETEEAKRRLRAKLAYHKAIAATKDVISQKLQKADSLRFEAKKLKEEFEIEQEMEREKRRSMAAEIHEDFTHSKKLFEQVQQGKRRKAEELKKESYKLKEEARWKEQDDFKIRKEKIQRIQASKLALREATSKKFSPASFIAALGSPDVEIRLKLTKESLQAELQEKRKKVIAAKEEREKKFLEVKQRVENRTVQNSVKRDLYGKIGTLPSFKHSMNDDKEINQLVRELKKFQMIDQIGKPVRWPYLNRH